METKGLGFGAQGVGRRSSASEDLKGFVPPWTFVGTFRVLTIRV